LPAPSLRPSPERRHAEIPAFLFRFDAEENSLLQRVVPLVPGMVTDGVPKQASV